MNLSSKVNEMNLYHTIIHPRWVGASKNSVTLVCTGSC